jgi:aminoglycoside phosphotransferase (APT) family kinase protein
MRKTGIAVDVVSFLISTQFPQWADLPIRPVALDGWDNTTFRLGDEMSVRLPSHARYVPQIDKEHRWLPALGPHLPLPIPRPITKGKPGCGFPSPWSIYGWLEGEPAAVVVRCRPGTNRHAPRSTSVPERSTATARSRSGTRR